MRRRQRNDQSLRPRFPVGRAAGLACVGACLIGLAGCASSLNSIPTSAVNQVSVDQRYDCKALLGRMQIRILQMRDFATTRQGTGLSQSFQAAGTTVFGGTWRGVNPGKDYAADRAELESNNAELAANNCATYDLDYELDPQRGHDLPEAKRRTL